jgi:MarC family membrane protein
MMNANLAIQHLLHNLPSAASETFLALFPIVNPLGGIPLFFSLTADYSPEERRKTGLKTALYVIAILVVFMLFGRFVLHFFGISLPVLKIAGGLIVANTAWDMVTGSHPRNHGRKPRSHDQRRYFANAHGHAHALGAGFDRCRHGAGSGSR